MSATCLVAVYALSTPLALRTLLTDLRLRQLLDQTVYRRGRCRKGRTGVCFSTAPFFSGTCTLCIFFSTHQNLWPTRLFILCIHSLEQPLHNSESAPSFKSSLKKRRRKKRDRFYWCVCVCVCVCVCAVSYTHLTLPTRR